MISIYQSLSKKKKVQVGNQLKMRYPFNLDKRTNKSQFLFRNPRRRIFKSINKQKFEGIIMIFSSAVIFIFLNKILSSYQLTIVFTESIGRIISALLEILHSIWDLSIVIILILGALLGVLFFFGGFIRLSRYFKHLSKKRKLFRK